MRVGHVIIKMLRDYGVTHIFGVPGGHTLPLYEAIHDSMSEITHILFREETNAGFAADGYSKVKSRIGVVDATLGPGALRLMPAITESYSSSTAILALIGDIEIRNMVVRGDRSNAAQAVPHIHIFKPITKDQILVLDSKTIPSAVRKGIRIATSYRPGPTLIDVPTDILWSEDEYEEKDLYTDPYESEVPSYRIMPTLDHVKNAINEIINAERPLIIIGGGVHLSKAWLEVEELVDALGIPIISTISGKGGIKETHPLYLGVMGALGGWRSADRALESSDVVIVIGSRLSQYTTYDWKTLEDKKIIHIDIDPSELGRSFKEYIKVLGDVRETIRMMINIIKKMILKGEWKGWAEEVNKLKREWERYLSDEIYGVSREITPQYVVSQLSRSMDEETIVVSDASSSSGWTAMLIKIKSSERYYLAPRGVGGLGYGVPAGIGAYYAVKGSKDVIVITGDGGLGYVLSEMETIKRLGIPLKIVILNDYGLGWIKLLFKAYLDNKIVSSDFYKVNYADVANAFGIEGIYVDGYGEIKEVIEYLVKTDGAILLDIPTKTDTPFWPLKEDLKCK